MTLLPRDRRGSMNKILKREQEFAGGGGARSAGSNKESH